MNSSLSRNDGNAFQQGCYILVEESCRPVTIPTTRLGEKDCDQPKAKNVKHIDIRIFPVMKPYSLTRGQVEIRVEVAPPKYLFAPQLCLSSESDQDNFTGLAWEVYTNRVYLLQMQGREEVDFGQASSPH